MPWQLNKQIERFVEDKFVNFGINKKREIIRLLFEIVKRESCSIEKILSEKDCNTNHYAALKNKLIKIRYPDCSPHMIKRRLILPELSVDPNCSLSSSRYSFQPKRLIIEETVSQSNIVHNIKLRFPAVEVIPISKLKDYINKRPYSIKDFNERLEEIYVIKERHHYISHCPCSKETQTCNYHILNLGYGCPYNCAYCILQAYTNSPGVILPANIDDFFRAFTTYNQNIRIGTGQFTDSLAFDDLTEYSTKIVEFFNQHPQAVFEFKTKSSNIHNLIKIKPNNNIVVSWSLNPQEHIDNFELGTDPLSNRITAAQKCIESGYRVGFHFDPIIHSKGWQDKYHELVTLLFNQIDTNRIAWISLGCLRLTMRLKKIIENRFPETNLLDESLLPGYDNKLRYPFAIRETIYKNMIDWIQVRNKNQLIYLCMEEPLMNKCCGLAIPDFK